MTRQCRSELGFTLIELMISAAILGIVTSQIFMILGAQKRVYVSNERVLDVQEDSRTVLDLISFDMRMAGFMVPRISGISSVDGGNAASDSLCISDANYFDFPSGTAASDGLDNQALHFDATGVTGFGANSATVVTFDIDGDNAANDFGGPGSGVILSDGVNSHCARITSIVGNTINFAPSAPNAGLWNVAGIRAVPAILYELQAPLTLTRNGLTLATAVEDLQVEYWVDNSPANGVIDNANEFPVHDLNNAGGLAMDTSTIRRVRVTVIARTDQTEGGYKQDFANGRRPASANRLAADDANTDSFRRRRFTTSVLPRNLL